MRDLNRFFISGKVYGVPELKTTKSSKVVCRLSVGVLNGKPGNFKRDFLDVTIWNKQAEACAQYLTEGRQVLVEGRLAKRKWKGQDGQNRSRIEMIATSVRFLDKKPDSESLPDNSSATGQEKGHDDIDECR